MPTVPDVATPLRVGISSNVLEFGATPGRLDGIGIYTRELEAALIARGIDVRRIGAPVRAGARFVRATNAALSFPLPMAYLTAAATALHTPLPFAATVERAIDVYHATDYLVPKLARTPVVATLYDAIPLTNPEWANPRLRAMKNWLLKHCAQAADVVIAISNAAVADLVEYYRIPRARIRVIQLGVDLRWFDRPPAVHVAATLRAHGLARGYFLHVGTLQPRKNLDALVTAYERLPPAVQAERQLVLVGKYGWGVPGLRDRLLSKRAAGRVVWLDYVPRDVLQALYYGAGGFVFPSLGEGFGLPVLEALAVGLPVVASELPALVEIAQGYATFVTPASIDALAAALATIDVTCEASGASESRRNHARTFTWARCASETHRLYGQLIH
jgi:alpha-1,3-rhamnosyl/mannosyltransferase